VSPNLGTGAGGVFTFQVWDTAGAADLATVSGLIGYSAYYSCAVVYNQAQNSLALLTDDGAIPASTIAPGSGTQQNSQCVLDGRGSSVTTSGDYLNLNLAIGFKIAFDGSTPTYGAAQSISGTSTGWRQLGNWTVAVSSQPLQASVTPTSGTGVNQMFNLVYTDPNGGTDLLSTQVLISTTTTLGVAACSIMADPLQGYVWLQNDANTAWLGPQTLGVAGILQNSQCSVDAGASSGVIYGDTYSWRVAVSFAPGFAGAKNLYGYATTYSGLTSGYLTLGTWTVGAVPRAVPGDFDGNGTPDLVWQCTDGSVVVWYLGGADGSSYQSAALLSGPSSGWRIAAVADLNGDGIPDLIWQSSDGSVVVWYMGGANGSTYRSAALLAGPSSGWRIVAVADLNGDGIPDLIWQGSDGSVVVWYMSGANGSAYQSAALLASPSSGWRIAAVADLNGDGIPDLIWQSSDGSVVVWYMGGANGSTYQNSALLAGPSSGWRIAAVADLNADSRPELIWQSNDGSVVAWYMGGANGSTYQSAALLSGPSSGWLVVAM
jgi:hypothetical protein